MGDLALFAGPDAAEPVVQAGKPLAILVYLAFSPGRWADRDRLADLFWPGTDPADAHHSLRQTLYRLRQAVGEPLVGLAGTRVTLDGPVRLDCIEGEAAADAGKWEQAANLLRGNFLEGFAVAGSREFEEWAEARRLRFRGVRARALESFSHERLDAGAAESALEIAEELATLRPFDDAPVRLCMASYAALGRYATAVARFHAYADGLTRELDEEPWARLLAHIHEVLPLQCPDCGADLRILAFLTEPEPVPDFDDLDPIGGARGRSRVRPEGQVRKTCPTPARTPGTRGLTSPGSTRHGPGTPPCRPVVGTEPPNSLDLPAA